MIFCHDIYEDRPARTRGRLSSRTRWGDGGRAPRRREIRTDTASAMSGTSKTVRGLSPAAKSLKGPGVWAPGLCFYLPVSFCARIMISLFTAFCQQIIYDHNDIREKKLCIFDRRDGPSGPSGAGRQVTPPGSGYTPLPGRRPAPRPYRTHQVSGTLRWSGF